MRAVEFSVSWIFAVITRYGPEIGLSEVFFSLHEMARVQTSETSKGGPCALNVRHQIKSLYRSRLVWGSICF